MFKKKILKYKMGCSAGKINNRLVYQKTQSYGSKEEGQRLKITQNIIFIRYRSRGLQTIPETYSSAEFSFRQEA